MVRPPIHLAIKRYVFHARQRFQEQIVWTIRRPKRGSRRSQLGMVMEKIPQRLQRLKCPIQLQEQKNQTDQLALSWLCIDDLGK